MLPLSAATTNPQQRMHPDGKFMELPWNSALLCTGENYSAYLSIISVIPKGATKTSNGSLFCRADQKAEVTRFSLASY